MTETKKEKTTRKVKKEKSDIDKPKSGYIFFCIDKRKEIVENSSEKIKNTEIVTMLGSLWTKLKIENPEKYISYMKLAELDKQRYNTEMSENKKSESENVLEVETETLEVVEEPVKQEKKKRGKKSEVVEVVEEEVVDEKKTKQKR